MSTGSTGHSCHGSVAVEAPAGARKIVLVGNPNVGKSLFFNAFTGLYVDVSNFPGTTVAISSGRMGDDVVLDTPGIYGVSSFNDEETVARDIVMEADVVVNVVDAVHLERDLFLTQQVIDMGLPVVVALNMIDEAEARGVAVDADELSRLLGVPVIPTVAPRREGFDEVRRAIDQARPGCSDPILQDRLTGAPGPGGDARRRRCSCWRAIPTWSERHGVEPHGPARRRLHGPPPPGERGGGQGRDPAGGAAWTCAPARPRPHPPADRHSRAGRHSLPDVRDHRGVRGPGRSWASPRGRSCRVTWSPSSARVVELVTGSTGVAYELLAGEFGVLTLTVTYIFGLLLPLVIAFYVLLSTLEDSGYLPRIAALSDRLMTAIGLNGRAIIPMILGFGCITMATITTRILGNERERQDRHRPHGVRHPVLGPAGGHHRPAGRGRRRRHHPGLRRHHAAGLRADRAWLWPATCPVAPPTC